MKKLIALLLAMSICILCAACGGDKTTETKGEPILNDAETTAPVVETTEAPTEEATEAPTEEVTEPVTEPAVVYTNPLTGEVLEAPSTTRPVVVSVSNVQSALPHRGVYGADILFETYVNGSVVRCLAVYSDITKVEAIGSTRSARPILVDIASHYNAFYAHAGGSGFTNSYLASSGIDNMNVDTWDDSGYSFRDKARSAASSWEHCLFTRGAELMEHITTEKKVDMSQDPDTSFGLQFAADGTPADGEAAEKVTITMKFSGSSKETIMIFNKDTGLYEYNQYGKTMIDEATNEAESFTNVIVMFAKITTNSGYHVADFVKGGEGYYACGGKMIPITWKCAGEDQPFTFYTEDGEVLNMGVGSSYIAVVASGSTVTGK